MYKSILYYKMYWSAYVIFIVNANFLSFGSVFLEFEESNKSNVRELAGDIKLPSFTAGRIDNINREINLLLINK